LPPAPAIQKVLGRGTQAVVRGGARCASQVLDRGAKTDAYGRSLLHIRCRGAKADACGRCFAVLSTQVSIVGLRLRHNRLTRGSILEVNRDAAAAGEEQLASCTAEQIKYCLSEQ
jgi:hypothetical protein